MTLPKVLYLLPLLLPPQQSTHNHLFATAIPPRKDWSKLDLDTLQEEWKAGDNAEELATPDDELYQLLEQKRKSSYERIESLIHDVSGDARNAKRLEHAALDARHAGKAVVIFATLLEDGAPEDEDGWDWDSMASVCDEWSHRLSYALVEINCYPIEPTESDAHASILITTARGWNGDDIYKFLVEHPHPKSIVSEVKWNEKTTKL